MPIPLVIAGAAVLAAVPGAYSASKPFLHRYLQRNRPAIEKWAMANALEAAGFPDLMDESLSRDDFTRAINEKFLAGTDLQLTNIFDAQAIKDDALKMAMKKAAGELGIELRSATIDGMKEALGVWIRAQVQEQIDGGGGDLIDGAKDLSSVLAIIKSVQKGLDENGDKKEEELDMSPEGVSNRERQAKYRASHKRHWEER